MCKFLLPTTCITLLILIVACSPVKNLKKANVVSLRLVSQYNLPNNTLFKNTVVGGLSGIDYDAANNTYYIISDDRSNLSAARYYTAAITIGNNVIDTVIINGVHTLLQQNGQAYPNNKVNAALTPDPENIRLHTPTGLLYWNSEGERIVTAKDTILNNPSICIIKKDGSFIDSLPLPSQLVMHASKKGPRQNGVLEGSTFNQASTVFFTNVEEPLYEDGPRADTLPNKAFIRIFSFDIERKKNTAQYAYELDAVAYPPNPNNAFMVNGVPDILWESDSSLLVVERSFSTGRQPCTIKIFRANFANATNVISVAALANENTFTPMKKQLLINLDKENRYIDNIEGITWGPILPNGKRSIVAVADNNFSPLQQQQFLLFEVK